MKSSEDAYQIFDQNYNSKFLILCDHATNRIPMSVSKTQLGLKSKELQRHIAYDIGAKDTALNLGKILGAPLITTNYSRLVIDPNRSKEDPTSIMQIYDGAIIKGNCNLTPEQVTLRQKLFYDPYHNAIANFLKKKQRKKITPCIVSIHSFTPQLNQYTPRPWHIGILWGKDTRMSNAVLSEFTKFKDIRVGENQPYSGNLNGDTLSKHGIYNNLLHVLIEIRNDLIDHKGGQIKWAKIIKTVLNRSIKQIKE